MSKAKELATNVISQMEEIQRQVMNNNSLSGFTNDWQSGFNHAMIELRNRLNEAVLSEPEPELKEWIEVDEQGLVMSININQIEWFGDQRIRLANGDSSVRLLIVKESYDELKQKIKEAS